MFELIAELYVKQVSLYCEKPPAQRGVRLWTGRLPLWADEVPVGVAGTVVRLTVEKQRPPKTPDDLLDDLRHAGVPRSSDKVRILSRCGPHEQHREDRRERLLSTHRRSSRKAVDVA